MDKLLPLNPILNDEDDDDEKENEINDHYCCCGKSEHKILYPLHEMIYQNCSVNKIRKYIYDNGSSECIETVDCGGNTPLMVALKLKRVKLAVFIFIFFLFLFCGIEIFIKDWSESKCKR